MAPSTCTQAVSFLVGLLPCPLSNQLSSKTASLKPPQLRSIASWMCNSVSSFGNQTSSPVLKPGLINMLWKRNALLLRRAACMAGLPANELIPSLMSALRYGLAQWEQFHAYTTESLSPSQSPWLSPWPHALARRLQALVATMRSMVISGLHFCCFICKKANALGICGGRCLPLLSESNQSQ